MEKPSDEVAAAIRDHAAAIKEAAERLGPAADALAGLDWRLDALCKWFKSAWPWAAVIALYGIQQIAPELADALRGAMAHGLPQ